jgi:hypothetical protein
VQYKNKWFPLCTKMPIEYLRPAVVFYKREIGKSGKRDGGGIERKFPRFV